jgi:hypothetical protein
VNESIITANLNNARCIVERNHFGYDTFVNICTGKSVDVSWTFGNWAGFTALFVLGFLMVLLVGFIIYMIASDRIL